MHVHQTRHVGVHGGSYGGVERAKQLHRDERTFLWLEQTLQNLRYAFRRLRRSPGFSLTVVLILALGIGATTAMFSLIDGILLRPLPFREPFVARRKQGRTLSSLLLQTVS